MRTAPSIVLLDAGDLERPAKVLSSLSVDFSHLRADDIGASVPLPRDLLVTSLDLALEIPAFEHPQGETLEPTWVCIAERDFRPLRAQLRDLGVHYLIDARLDAESMRLFFLQLLARAPETVAETRIDAPAPRSTRSRRRAQKGKSGEKRTFPRKEYRRRLWALGDEKVDVVLGHDLSLTGIRVDSDSRLVVGDRVELALYGGPREEPLVVKAAAVRDHGDGRLGLRFEDLSEELSDQLRGMLDKLPPLESLCDDTSSGLVVSKVLSKSD